MPCSHSEPAWRPRGPEQGASGSRVAVTLVEIVVCLVIFVLALVPIVDLFTASQRTGFSARRLLDATLHAQVLLEAITQLDSTELPDVAEGRQVTLLDSAGGAAGAGSGRWPQVVAFFRQPPPIPGMTRKVTAQRLTTGELLIRVEVGWIAVVHDSRTWQRLELRAFAAPGNWQEKASVVH